MTIEQIEKELKSGKTLQDLFEFSAGQDCDIYKADSFVPGDEVIYIPDLKYNNVVTDRQLTDEEIKHLPLYTGEDFLYECNGKEDAAELLFDWCDWQHPCIKDIEQELNENGNLLHPVGNSISNSHNDEIRIAGIIFEHGKNDYGLWEGFNLSKEDENAIQQILMKYDTEGCSTRGTMKEISMELGR